MTYYCTYCGSQIDETTGVCPYCGATYTIPAQSYAEPKKKKFPVIAIAIVATALVVAAAAALLLGTLNGMFAPKGGKASAESTSQAAESEAHEDNTESVKIVPAITPEEAVDIYMANMDVWRYEDKNDYIEYAYYLIDLDFDGVLELIRGKINSKSYFADNTSYRIDVDTQRVEEIEDQSKKYCDSLARCYTGTLYMSKADGTRFYLYYSEELNDVIHYLGYGKIYLDGDAFQDQMVYSENYSAYGYDNDPNKHERYCIGANTEVTKDEYDKYIEDFADENTDLKLNSTVISGSDFDDADFDSQRKQLLEAYYSFSYDGFSFEN